jgi:A/G-specific adenine glycosylase
MKFSSTLTNWYSIYKRELPWRNTKDPYYIWLSEIILQQTQIKQGLPYYEVFVNEYPTVFDLAKADEKDVLKLWQGLGYYSRARNLHHTSKFIVENYDGEFPKSYDELLKLKGIGDYTASAIASICYNEPTAVVDGNVYRVLARYFGISTPINSTHGIKEFKVLASKLIDVNNPADYNQAIMEFGATQCKPNNPDCELCPLNLSCVALKNDSINTLPVKINKVKVTQKYFNFLVVISSQKTTLFNKRTGKGIWKNLYQFPLVETEAPLSSKQFKKHPKVKTILKDINFEYSLYNNTDIIHKLSHQHLYTRFWIVEVDLLPKKSVLLTELKTYPVPVLISNFINEFDLAL